MLRLFSTVHHEDTAALRVEGDRIRIDFDLQSVQ
jgi:hypothetical protein